MNSTDKGSYDLSREKFCRLLAPLRVMIKNRGKIFLTTYVSDRKKFEENIQAFYKTAQSKKSPPTTEVSDLLKDNFIVGEPFHSDITPKKFLIEKMKELKKAGFDTLFMEHLYYDDDQQALDDFYKTGVMSRALSERLEYLDNGFGAPQTSGPNLQYSARRWAQNNFSATVKAAQAAGVRVVGIDIKVIYDLYQPDGRVTYQNPENVMNRMRHMNSVATQIIRRETENNKGSKWCALMGGHHAMNYHNTPGIPELTGARSVFIFDTGHNADEYRNPLESYHLNQEKLRELSFVKMNGTHQIGDDKITGNVIIGSHPDQALPVFDPKVLASEAAKERKTAEPDKGDVKAVDSSKRKSTPHPSVLFSPSAQQIYQSLKKLRQDFKEDSTVFISLINKKIREEGDDDENLAKQKNAIIQFETHLVNNPELSAQECFDFLKKDKEFCAALKKSSGFTPAGKFIDSFCHPEKYDFAKMARRK